MTVIFGTTPPSNVNRIDTTPTRDSIVPIHHHPQNPSISQNFLGPHTRSILSCTLPPRSAHPTRFELQLFAPPWSLVVFLPPLPFFCSVASQASPPLSHLLTSRLVEPPVILLAIPRAL
eukprot:768810-Hanusia_phi.AAC.16